MSDVAAAAAARRSPSPWSRFLSPSLFSQRSTPGQPTAPIVPSPLKESTAVPHQPGLFTHAKEINPFERSFAILDQPFAAHDRSAANGALAGHNGMHPDHDADRTDSGHGPAKRKRALSSPAVLTPGGSALPFIAGDGTLADFIQKAKRPNLNAHNQDSGVGLLDERDFAGGMGPYSLRTSANNSFDSTTGSSLLRHRRGVSLSESPDTSIAPSPPSPKQGPSPPAGAPGPANATGFAPEQQSQHRPDEHSFSHFQTQPMPFAMPLVPPPTAFAHASTALYPPAPAPVAVAASVAPNAVIPPPPAYAFGVGSIDTVGMNGGPSQFLPPPPGHGPYGADYAPVSAHRQFVASSISGAGLSFDPSLALPEQGMFSNGPVDAPLRQQQPYAGYPALPPPPPPPPPSNGMAGHPSAVPTGGMYPAPATSSVDTSGSTAAASMSPVARGRTTSSHPKAPASDRSSVTPAPSRPPGPKKRGRKPKNWDPATEQTVELDPEEQEKQRKLALERNRVAASKSRRRKKERVELLETAAAELCSRNVALQAECRTLLAEVHSLRTYMSQAHAQGSCTCQHVNGYLAREAEGGGIPAILYGAGKTLERDYAHPPKWGSEDDALAGAIELRALERITRGDPLDALPEAERTGGPSTTNGNNRASKGNKSQTASVGRTTSRRTSSRDLDVDELKPVVGRAKGAIPIRNNNNNTAGGPTTTNDTASGLSLTAAPPQRPGMATRRSSSIAVNTTATVTARGHESEHGTDVSNHKDDDDDEDDDDDDVEDEQESEAEHIALKSRRARAIPLRKVA
ncbi:hypothetical protein JCM3774_005435 [Rhodotorula dairenensis]